MSQLYYGGTGGYDGDEHAKGVAMPLLYGKRHSAKPVCVHRGKSIWQIHNLGPINRISFVFHGLYDIDIINTPRGQPFPDLFGPTVDEWQRNLTAEGKRQCCIDLDHGAFRLSFVPDDIILCAAEGPGINISKADLRAWVMEWV